MFLHQKIVFMSGGKLVTLLWNERRGFRETKGNKKSAGSSLCSRAFPMWICAHSISRSLCWPLAAHVNQTWNFNCVYKKTEKKSLFRLVCQSRIEQRSKLLRDRPVFTFQHAGIRAVFYHLNLRSGGFCLSRWAIENNETRHYSQLFSKLHKTPGGGSGISDTTVHSSPLTSSLQKQLQGARY